MVLKSTSPVLFARYKISEIKEREAERSGVYYVADPAVPWVYSLRVGTSRVLSRPVLFTAGGAKLVHALLPARIVRYETVADLRPVYTRAPAPTVPTTDRPHIDATPPLN